MGSFKSRSELGGDTVRPRLAQKHKHHIAIDRTGIFAKDILISGDQLASPNVQSKSSNVEDLAKQQKYDIRHIIVLYTHTDLPQAISRIKRRGLFNILPLFSAMPTYEEATCAFYDPKVFEPHT